MRGQALQNSDKLLTLHLLQLPRSAGNCGTGTGRGPGEQGAKGALLHTGQSPPRTPGPGSARPSAGSRGAPMGASPPPLYLSPRRGV